MTRPMPRPSWTIWPGARACLLAVLVWAVPAQGSEPWFSFAGEVARGETFRQRLGQDFWFELQPDSQGWGWYIWIGDPRQPHDNYAAVVTPPYHGINQLQLFGWHFRNADNSGPNVAGPKNVNAPQAVRGFRFVLNDQDHDDAMAALRRLMWGPVESEDIGLQLRNQRRGLAKGEGQLEITDMTLGNLVTGEMARFERMAFTVQLMR